MAENNKRKWIVLALVAALAIIVVIVIAGRAQAPAVPIVKVSREDLSSAITSNGKVEPISPFVMRAQLDTFIEKIYVVEGQNVKKGQRLLDLNVKDAQAQLAQGQAKLLTAEEALRVAKGGGQPAEAAQATGALATAVAQRDRLQRTHDALQRLIDQHAATKDELAANDVDLAKAQADVTRLTGYGFARHLVMEELRAAGGNVDQALAALFAKSFHVP